ncbi:MAG: hypothetical protein KBD01_14165 [Acidobacteria bacterium]|nr:hypothetical protein [Acidobacteriota bacterium]
MSAGRGRDRRRAPPGARRAAVLAGAAALVAVHLPLVAGYARMQLSAWRQMTEVGIVPAAEFYAPWPLQAARLFVVALFTVDVAGWAALLALLPLDEPHEPAFSAARRRLRRRWLFAHAPVLPIAAFLVAARLFGEAQSGSGAGAAWFLPELIATSHPPASELWVRAERLVLLSLGGALAAHLALLGGIVRPTRWIRNTAAMLGVAVAVAALDIALVLPLVDGGLSRGMAAARASAAAACPGLDALPAPERVETTFNTFVRTTADSPALREYPDFALPDSVVALPPLAWSDWTGLAVRLEAPGGALLSAGEELRAHLDGSLLAMPIPDLCGGQRVLKADRGLSWNRMREVLARAGSGPLRLAFRPAPFGGRPLVAPARPLDVVLARPGAVVPGGVPHADVPLPFAAELPHSRVPRAVAPRARLREGRASPYSRAAPLDPLWQDALPACVAPDLSNKLETALAIPPEAAWDDVLRALAAAADAGARRVFLVTDGI